MWAQFEGLLKVSGGGDAGVVWRDINENDPLGLAINIMITDFALMLGYAVVPPEGLRYLSLDASDSFYRDSFIARIAQEGFTIPVEDLILDRTAQDLKVVGESDADTDVIVFPMEIPIPPEFLTPADKEKRALIARTEAAQAKLDQISTLIEQHWPIALIDAVPRNPFDQKAKQITAELRAILAS